MTISLEIIIRETLALVDGNTLSVRQSLKIICVKTKMYT